MFQSMSYTLDTPRHSRRIMLLLLLRLVPHDFLDCCYIEEVRQRGISVYVDFE